MAATTSRQVRTYRGAGDTEAERAYHDDAVIQGSLGSHPVELRWHGVAGDRWLAVTYERAESAPRAPVTWAAYAWATAVAVSATILVHIALAVTVAIAVVIGGVGRNDAAGWYQLLVVVTLPVVLGVGVFAGMRLAQLRGCLTGLAIGAITLPIWLALFLGNDNTLVEAAVALVVIVAGLVRRRRRRQTL
mgnify:CR=1 FL=1